LSFGEFLASEENGKWIARTFRIRLDWLAQVQLKKCKAHVSHVTYSLLLCSNTVPTMPNT